jgi:hypothetical protein
MIPLGIVGITSALLFIPANLWSLVGFALIGFLPIRILIA